MKHNARKNLVFAIAGLFLLSPVTAFAIAPSVDLRGTIASVDGNTLKVKERNGNLAEVHVADHAAIVSVAKAKMSDIKPGDFIGTAATPRTDGTLQAIEVHIFPESLRGTGEGTRAWDLAPKSSMTNGTVAQQPNRVENNKVNKIEGDNITVEYKGGTKVVATTSSTKVVTLVPGDRSELKPNTEVFIPGAAKNSDGSLEATRITVGKEGVPPPM